MANRTSILVLVAAVTMLVASFSLQSDDALAVDAEATALVEIEAIKGAAWSAIDDAVAAAITEIGGAIKVGHATSAHNAGLNAVDSIYSAAVDDIAVAVEGAPGADPVVAAGAKAIGALEVRTAQANAELDAAYEAWLAANWGWTAAEIIADIEWWVQHGAGRLDDIVGGFADGLGNTGSTDEAGVLRDEALADIAQSVEQTIAKVDSELARMPDDPDVRTAHTQALADSQAAGDAAERSVNQQFDAFVDVQPPATTTTTSTVPPATTTTTRPPETTSTTPIPTTTTLAPTTTTSIPPTTTTTTTTTATTTMPAVAQLPPIDPPMFEFMAELPAPVVLSATSESSSELPDESSMATVGLVHRVVDSQLPAGVSTVAAGPLVVIGLIIDAIRAAGALMAVPWLLLGVYMAGLLRNSRTPLERSA